MKSNNNAKSVSAWITAPGIVLLASAVHIRPAQCATAVQSDFDIAPGRLHARLEQFASFTGTQIAYDVDPTATTRGVHGRYTTEEGLMVLLEGTGLLCERFPGRPEISVHPPRSRQKSGRTCLVLPESSPPELVLPAGKPNNDVREVTVSALRNPGTHFHDTPQIGSSLTSWDEEQIRVSGAQFLPDILETTQNFEGGPTQDTHFGSAEAAANTGFGTGVNLRGLGTRSTLVLLNGHPVAPSGSDASFVDLLQFPLAATSKVSMMPDGASGIYGTQAVAGVIDINTPGHYSRPQSHIEAGTLTDGHTSRFRLSHVMGTQWNGGSLMGVAEVIQWDALPASERGQANTARVPYTNPGNLQTTQGTFPIPSGQPGQPLDFGTLTAGRPRLGNPQLDADILPAQTRLALYGSLDQTLTPVMKLWSYVLWTERYGQESLGGQEAYLDVTHSPFLSSPPPGPVSEEYNLLKDFGPEIATVNVRTLNAAVELHIQLPRNWHLVLSGSDSLETEAQVTTGQVDTAALQASVSSTKPADAFNPLGDGSNTAAPVLESLNIPKWFGSVSQLRSYEAVADGPLLLLGTGPLSGAFGFEARSQRFAWAFSEPAVANDLSRQIYAAYTELRVPLLDADTFDAPFRRLAVTFAGRMERYSDFGRSATPRIGCKWTPYDYVQLRGALAGSVRAPDLGDLSQRTNSSFVTTLSGTPALIWSGGRPNLTVERALTRTAGVTIDSGTALPERLSFDLSWFDIVSRNRLEREPLVPDVLTSSLYSGFVTHIPPPSLQQYVCNNSTFIGGTRDSCLQSPVGAVVDLRAQNAGTLWTDGIDVRTGVSGESRAGSWGVDLAGTYILHYREATLPAASLISELNTESHPLALHLFADVSWKLGGARTDVIARYMNGYRDDETNPVTHAGSWMTTDLRLAYTFGGDESLAERPVEIAVFARNLFDRYPPFSDNLIANTGYDQENGDLSGRQVNLSVHVKW